ncbi:hypothetical protein GCM10009668_17810 [Nocardioides dubius]|uniref:Uncharacterized protein n=1 Tax=Nocardioides dubius TaxID=317019 RepID=A0ABP4EAL9_9ACTN
MPGLGDIAGRPAHRGVEPIGARGRVGVDLEADPVAAALSGVRDHGVQQTLGHSPAAGLGEHADVGDIGAGRVTDELGAHQCPGRGTVVQLGQPPVVPAVARVLAEPEDELLEGLLGGVEVIGERLFEHVVHAAQVRLLGQSLGVASHQPEADAVAGPCLRVRHQRRLLGGHRPRHVPPLAHLGEAGPRKQILVAGVVGERLGVDLLDVEPASAAHLHRLSLGPGHQHRGAPPCQRRGAVAIDHRAEDHPGDRAVVHHAPGDDPAVVVADHHVLADPLPALADLHADVVGVGARPAPAYLLVPAPQRGQPFDQSRISGIGWLDGVPGRQGRVIGQ